MSNNMRETIAWFIRHAAAHYRYNSYVERILYWCLKQVETSYGFDKYKEEFTQINADLSKQYTQKVAVSPYYELNLRNQHCFQALFTEKAIRKLYRGGGKCELVDIGDSAGNHLKYLQHLFCEDAISINGLSVNLDKTAVDKINASGGKAILCRAEDYNPAYHVDFYLSYEMVEHLHNPALFLYKIAKADKGKYMIITVPYVSRSHVALRRSMDGGRQPITAEQEHIFELSPKDWKKICMHAGWRVIHSEIYFQYPRHLPVVSPICKALWKKYDFEGFLGLVLRRDMSAARRYTDWEE